MCLHKFPVCIESVDYVFPSVCTYYLRLYLLLTSVVSLIIYKSLFMELSRLGFREKIIPGCTSKYSASAFH